jgi:hypothetical protein
MAAPPSPAPGASWSCLGEDGEGVGCERADQVGGRLAKVHAVVGPQAVQLALPVVAGIVVIMITSVKMSVCTY